MPRDSFAEKARGAAKVRPGLASALAKVGATTAEEDPAPRAGLRSVPSPAGTDEVSPALTTPIGEEASSDTLHPDTQGTGSSTASSTAAPMISVEASGAAQSVSPEGTATAADSASLTTGGGEGAARAGSLTAFQAAALVEAAGEADVDLREQPPVAPVVEPVVEPVAAAPAAPASTRGGKGRASASAGVPQGYGVPGYPVPVYTPPTPQGFTPPGYVPPLSDPSVQPSRNWSSQETAGPEQTATQRPVKMPYTERLDTRVWPDQKRALRQIADTLNDQRVREEPIRSNDLVRTAIDYFLHYTRGQVQGRSEAELLRNLGLPARDHTGRRIL